MTTECAQQAGVGSERPSLNTDIEALALQLWREREMTFPAYCRRMAPDDIDRDTGAWAGMVARATALTMGGPASQTVVPIR